MYQLLITKMKFTKKESNEEQEFYRFSSKLDNAEVIFNVDKEDKSMTNYLLDSLSVNEEGIEVPLTVSEKYGNFTFSFELEGEKFILQPREQDKRLVKFLLNKSLKVKV